MQQPLSSPTPPFVSPSFPPSCGATAEKEDEERREKEGKENREGYRKGRKRVGKEEKGRKGEVNMY